MCCALRCGIRLCVLRQPGATWRLRAAIKCTCSLTRIGGSYAMAGHSLRTLLSSSSRRTVQAAVCVLTLVHSPPSGPSGAQQGQSLSPQGAGEGAGDGLGMGRHLPSWHHSPSGQLWSPLHSPTGGEGLGEGDSSTTQIFLSLQTSTSPFLPCRCAGE